MMGRQVSKLVSSQQTAGYKSVRWNATNDKGFPVNAGIYLYSIDAGQFRHTKKILLLILIYLFHTFKPAGRHGVG